MKQSQFYNEIGKIDLNQAISLIEKKADDTTQAKKMLSDFKNIFSEKHINDFMAIFGESTNVAILPINKKELSKITAKPALILHHLLIHAKPKNAKTAEFALQKFTKGFLPEKIDGHKFLTRNIADNVTIHILSDNGHFYLGFSPASIKKVVKTPETMASLADDPDYQKFHKQLSGADHFAFFNLQQIISLLQITIESSEDLKAMDFGRQLDFLSKSIKNAAASKVCKNGECTSNFMLDLTDNKPGKGFTHIFASPANPPTSINICPADTLLYICENGTTLKNAIDNQIASGKLNSEEIDLVNLGLKQQLGYDLSEIGKALGDEFALYARDIKITPFFPVPELAIMVKIADQAQADKIVSSFVQMNKKLPILTKDIANTKVSYLAVPMVPAQPCYMFHKGFLIISTHLELAENIINTTEEKSLAKSDFFAKVIDQPKAKSKQLTILDNEKLFERLDQIAEWGINYLSIQMPETADDVKEIKKAVVSPIINGLKTIYHVGQQTYIKDRQFKIINKITYETTK